jgi:hypothetical protein
MVSIQMETPLGSSTGVTPIGCCLPPPSPVAAAKAGTVETTFPGAIKAPSLPTAIGKRYSLTIPHIRLLATLRRDLELLL